MARKYTHKKQAFTLLECMIVMLILMVTFGGIMSFRYYAVLSSERAETQLLAARAAVVLSEAWRAQKGDSVFDPTQQGFADYFQIQSGTVAGFAGPVIATSTHLGTYRVEIEGRIFRTDLAYQNSADVPNARMLYVVLTWKDSKRGKQQFHLSTLTQT
jgi:prepilin-type N-terminal cleavage/methylation domain-containing protein